MDSQSLSLRVVVLDDEPLVLSGVSMLLETLGHAVTGVTDGQSVLDAVASGSDFDLAILDLHVRNGLGGLEIARQLSATSSIIVVLSSGDRIDADVYSGHGVHDSLPKPFTLNDLQSLIVRHFGAG